MKRKITVIKGPMFEQTKQNAQSYVLEIAKKYVDQGKYPNKSIS